jgi:hypothetical protein
VVSSRSREATRDERNQIMTVLTAVDKILNLKKLPAKLADLHMHGCKYLDVLIARYGQSTVADRSPYVDGEKLKREWKDCSLMMHSDRSLSLATSVNC